MDKLAMYMAIGSMPGVTFEALPAENSPWHRENCIVYGNKSISKDIKIVAAIQDDRMQMLYGYKRYGNSVWIIPCISQYSPYYNSFRNIGDAITFTYPDANMPLQMLETWLKLQTIIYNDWFVETEKHVDEVKRDSTTTKNYFYYNKTAAMRIKTMYNNPDKPFVYLIKLGYATRQFCLAELYTYVDTEDKIVMMPVNEKLSYREKTVASQSKQFDESFKPLRFIFKDIFKEVDKSD